MAVGIKTIDSRLELLEDMDFFMLGFLAQGEGQDLVKLQHRDGGEGEITNLVMGRIKFTDKFLKAVVLPQPASPVISPIPRTLRRYFRRELSSRRSWLKNSWSKGISLVKGIEHDTIETRFLCPFSLDF
ncbi:hypothetical protein MHLNE_12400 [Moorella humiferrea]